MNVLRMRQVTGASPDSGLRFQLLAQSLQDHDIRTKVIQMAKAPSTYNGEGNKKSSSMVKAEEGNAGTEGEKKKEVCDSNLCFNGAFCNPYGNDCVCQGHFIGKIKWRKHA